MIEATDDIDEPIDILGLVAIAFHDHVFLHDRFVSNVPEINCKTGWTWLSISRIATTNHVNFPVWYKACSEISKRPIICWKITETRRRPKHLTKVKLQISFWVSKEINLSNVFWLLNQVCIILSIVVNVGFYIFLETRLLLQIAFLWSFLLFIFYSWLLIFVWEYNFLAAHFSWQLWALAFNTTTETPLSFICIGYLFLLVVQTYGLCVATKWRKTCLAKSSWCLLVGLSRLLFLLFLDACLIGP